MTRKDITKVIRRLIRKWNKMGFSPQAINCGNCDEFAQEIRDACGCGNTIWGCDNKHLFRTSVDIEGHCFFMYRGYFYDSECKNGVGHPDLLPYYLRLNKNKE